MSTTTNFKRIALVAVAALGLGVLSSVPSNAAINADTLTMSTTAAAQTTNETYTSASAVATVSFFGAQNDSMSITAALTAAPAGNTSLPTLQLIETSSALIETNTVTAQRLVVGDTRTANSPVSIRAAASTSVTTAKFAVYLTSTNGVTAPSVVGSYTVKITPATLGTSGALQGSAAVSFTITVTTDAKLSKNAAASGTVSQIVDFGSDYDPALLGAAPTDSTVVAVKTASTTPKAVIFVKAKNAAGVVLTNTGESLTATITGAGTLGILASGGYVTSAAQTIVGKSISMRQTDYVTVFADGNAGPGTITFTGSTSGILIATKSINFSSDVATKYAASTIAATDSSVIAVGGTTKVSALAQDAQSFLVTGLGATDIYAFSSDTAVATVGATSYGSATVGYSATVTGVKVGTAQIIFGNASTLAASTIKSAGVTVRVGSSTPSNVTVTTDKATYAPGEKMTVTVTILDSTALPVVGGASYAGIFTSTGIVSSVNLSANSALESTTTVTNYSNTSNTKTYTAYAPVTGGPVTLSWTGGTGLATANQVAKTATFSVTDSGAAALAAVTALATTVASLKTLITTLTNLVLKIQKKVKA